MTKCAFPGCPNEKSPKAAKGLCNSHYWQMHKGRELTPLSYRRNISIPWLYAHVGYDSDECLTWLGRRKENGYGQLKIDGKMIGAHRAMCTLVHGEPPTPKHEAAHSCGNGHLGCVNPKHLRWATRQENVDDTLIHGTRIRGEKCHASKITEQVVRDIREIAEVMPINIIAYEYGLKNEHVRRVVARKTWRHVE